MNAENFIYDRGIPWMLKFLRALFIEGIYVQRILFHFTKGNIKVTGEVSFLKGSVRNEKSMLIF